MKSVKIYTGQYTLLSNKNVKEAIKNVRQSSCELLRIFIITLIVLHHIFINTLSLRDLNKTNYKQLICLRYILLKIISNYGQFSNNVFIMISGYFSVSKTNFNSHKFFSLLFEVYTYYYPSIIIGKKLSKKYKKYNLNFPNYSSKFIYFPILTSNGNWFAQTYLILIIFTPFINKGLLSLDKITYKNFVILIIIFYCIFKSITDYIGTNSSIFMITDVIRLLLPYIIGGFMKVYEFKRKILWKFLGLIYFPLTIIFEISFDYLSVYYDNFDVIKLYLNLNYKMNSIVSIIGGMGIIQLFINKKFYNKIINWMAMSVFGIYLLHGNKNISPYIYNIWFTTNNFNENYFFIKYILKAFLIIIISLVIDIIRRYTIGLLLEKIILKVLKHFK